MAACAGAPKTQPPVFSWQYYSFSILHNQEQPKDSPRMHIALDLVEVQQPANIAELFNRILYSGSTPQAYKNALIEQLRNDYRNVPGTTDSAALNWTYREAIDARRLENRGVEIERQKEVFTGGAHPSMETEYYVIDLESPRVLDINDLLYVTTEKTRELIYTYLRKHSGLKDGQPLSAGIYLTNEPELSSNFFITAEGMGFHWNAARIAPYSEGSIEIIVPWEDIRPQMPQSGVDIMIQCGIHFPPAPPEPAA
jgi:hypothetical protein